MMSLIALFAVPIVMPGIHQAPGVLHCLVGHQPQQHMLLSWGCPKQTDYRQSQGQKIKQSWYKDRYMSHLYYAFFPSQRSAIYGEIVLQAHQVVDLAHVHVSLSYNPLFSIRGGGYSNILHIAPVCFYKYICDQ